MIAFALVLALGSLRAGPDVAAELARLSSESARERAEAERWLAAHLAPEDFPALASAARAGRLEERTRIARALGSDPRHFELAVLCLVDTDPELASLGDEALVALATLWFGDELDPWSADRVALEIAGRSRGLVSIEPAAAPPAETLERLARHAPTFHTDRASDVTLGLSISPALYADMLGGKLISRTEPGVVRAGSFERALAHTLVDLRIGFEGHGFGGEHPFLRLGYGADLGSRRTPALIAEWCRDVLLFPDRPRGQGAAAALAGCGWPAPLAWLERRWFSVGDRNALVGLCIAAGRGRVTPRLATPALVEKLLREVAEQRSRDGAFDATSRRVRFALEHFPPLSGDGTDLAAKVASIELPGNDGAAFTACVLAAMGSAPVERVAAARAQLAQPLASGDEGAALLRLTLLRLVARTTRGNEAEFELALSAHLLARVVRERAGPQFLEWAQAAGAKPPRTLTSAEFAGRLGERELALAIEWLALAPATRPAAVDLVQRWLGGPFSDATLARQLSARARLGERETLRTLLAEVAKGTKSDTKSRLERLELLAELASDAQVKATVESLLAIGIWQDADWELAGAVAGLEAGAALRERLVNYGIGAAAAEKRSNPPWLAAYERLLTTLASRGEDTLANELRLKLRSALRSSPRHPLFRALESGAWPELPGPRPLSLEALDLGP